MFFQLHLLSPVLLISAIFFQFDLFTLSICSIIGLCIAAFGNSLVQKLIFFTMLGLIRGHFLTDTTQIYSYRRALFSATIKDIKIKEHGRYLILENLHYIPLDQCPLHARVGSFQKFEQEQYRLKKERAANKAAGIKTPRKKKINNENTETKKLYLIDEIPILPKTAQVKISDDLELHGNVINAKINAIGRFLLPMPNSVPQLKNNNTVTGLIDEITIENKNTNTFKSIMRTRFESSLSEQSARLAKAILLGDTCAITKNTRNIFQEAGIAHLLGVSVLNIAVLSMIFYFFLRRFIGLFFHKLALFVPLNVAGRAFALLLTATYCYLVGFEYPLLRSLSMSGLAIFALYFGRNRGLEILLWSAAGVLFVNPEAIYDISFQLSFGAVLGLCCAKSLHIKNKVLSYFIKALYSTLFASMLIIPISIYQFHTASIQPFLANIIAIPFVVFIITPLSLIWMLALLLPIDFLQNFSAYLLDNAFIIFHKIAEHTAPFGINIHVDPIFGYGCFTLILCIALFAIFKSKFKYIFLAIGYGAFIHSIITRPKPPFILVHPYAIGLFLEDKIVVYPKVNFIGEMWKEAYQKTAINGKIDPKTNEQYKTEYFYKDPSGKIIVLNKIGIITQELKCNSTVPTKNYVITYAELLKKTQQIMI